MDRDLEASQLVRLRATHAVRNRVPPGRVCGREALTLMQRELEQTPCRPSLSDSEVVFPVDRTRQLLERGSTPH